jgi:iron complex outermembrane recepter protein
LKTNPLSGQTNGPKSRDPFKLRPLAPAALGLAVMGFLTSPAVLAQSSNVSLQTVTVTGSSIKRSIESQQALPVSIYSADELKSQGVTSTEELVNHITSSQSSLGASQSVGSTTGGQASANLRGLGANKTLVLLDGRRLGFFPLNGASTIDLNSIPFAALDRVEVLRDGASAIYGTDAVGGVINFITKRNYSGMDLSLESLNPTSAGGGQSKRMTFSAGKGNLEEDGYNLWFSLDDRIQAPLIALDRSFGASGLIPSQGLAKTSGTTFPANFNYTKATGGVGSGNITYPNCAPPLSVSLGTGVCRFDYTAAIDLIPQTENTNLTTKGTFKLGGDKVLTLSGVASQNATVSRVAPDPVTSLTMPTSSPFYPSTYPGINKTVGLTGIGWRMVPAGGREATAQANASRVVADLTGTAGEWEYQTGFYATRSAVADSATNGYVNKAMIQKGITSGLLNPFGTNTAQALDYINSSKAFGLLQTGSGNAIGVDARFNRDLFAMEGGQAAISLGGEARQERYNSDTVDALVNSVPSAGLSPYHVDGASRTVSALTAEMLFPVTKRLELQAAARYDQYSDFGKTLNPKVGFRYSAASNVVLRGSATSGFRAPSLDELFGPQAATFSQNAYNDPVLCPGGKVTAAGIASRDCGQQVQALQGGNNGLQPEKSKSFSLGTAIQPSKDFLVTVDYWNIFLSNQIGNFPEQVIFADTASYGNRIIRCNTLSAAQAAKYDACNVVPNSNAIAYIRTLTDNLGNAKTNGLDFSAAWASVVPDMGRLTVNYEGTLVLSYKYQRTIGGEYIENVGTYQDSSPIFRWRHYLSTTLNTGAQRYTLGLRYISGYTDENVQTTVFNQVAPYTLVDAGWGYTGIKNLNVGVVLKNVFNTAPPFSNQGATFQQGYDPRYTDPLGRALMAKLSYKFY